MNFSFLIRSNDFYIRLPLKQIIAILTAAFLFSFHSLHAQAVNRCGTMGRVQQQIRVKGYVPSAPTILPGRQRQQQVQQRYALVTIPVVVHIVLPNPWLVTDADVQAQIDRLNLDFSGMNPDSTNVPTEFTRLRGHSNIRFCLARQTPDGKLTSGIERRVSTTGSDIMAQSDPIKYTADGGLDSWDPSRYLNYWVGADATGSGVLGYAQFPSSTLDPAASDGVVINYQAWGNNPCYTSSSFNQGRTAVHETGHYFGLLHTWGDDGNTCTGDDFADLTTAGSSCSLPSGLFNPIGQGNTATDVGDTPNQSGETNGCPTTQIVTDSCSKLAPGVMYQNLMDYSDDACLTLFTQKQVERMEWVLNNCRFSLTTSTACNVPAGAVALDAAPVQSVNPGGVETVGCTSTFYSSVLLCPGQIIPKVRIVNNGMATLTTITVGYSLNGGTPVQQVFNVNLPLGATAIISFPAVTVNSGNNTIQFFTSQPNGGTDQVTANDTLTETFTVLGTTVLPLMVDFESTTFPPSGWGIDNYNNDFTWERKSPGHNSTAALFINNFDVDATENLDDFKSPRINTMDADSVIITFDLAHRDYPQEGFSDTLTVLISKDCGATYQTVYKKWGAELATAGTLDEAYVTPADGDWRTEKIGLAGNILSTQNISVIFRNTTRYGNNIFIDNINIEGKKTNSLLRRRGFLVLPTVFRESFAVWYLEPPTELRSVQVFNTLGQRVYEKSFNGSTDTYVQVDLTSRAAGAYLVRLSYTDSRKDVSQWVFKQ